MTTEFGKRLKIARERAELTQPALAAKVPMAQSTLASAEIGGSGSRVTAQLAFHCGVDAYWLATGEGNMLAGATDKESLTVHPLSLAAALPVVLQALQKIPREQRTSMESDWAAVLAAPDSAELRQRLAELLTTPAQTPASVSPGQKSARRGTEPAHGIPYLRQARCIHPWRDADQ